MFRYFFFFFLGGGFRCQPLRPQRSNKFLTLKVHRIPELQTALLTPKVKSVNAPFNVEPKFNMALSGAKTLGRKVFGPKIDITNILQFHA